MTKQVQISHMVLIKIKEDAWFYLIAANVRKNRISFHEKV